MKYHNQERADSLQARLAKAQRVEADLQARLEINRWQRAKQDLIDSRPCHFEEIVMSSTEVK